MSLIYGYNNNENNNNESQSVKSFTTSITFTNYNYQKFVKVFDKGIVLLNISTTSQNKDHTGNVFYNFCNLDRSVSVKRIDVLKNNSGDKVLNAYTSLDSGSITAKLVNKVKGEKLMNNVKISVTLRYIELPVIIDDSKHVNRITNIINYK